MPQFDDYTQLTAPARGDVVGAIKDVSEALPENQTKYLLLEDLLKYGAFASKVLTVAASANVTLLNTDPMFVDITPTAARDVTCPAKSDDNHPYIIRNLSGTYTLTVKQSGGTTITTVAAGEVKLFIPSTINDFAALTIGSGGGSLSDGDKGDITVSASGATWTIDSGTVSLAKMANLAANSIIGNNTGSSATPIALTATQVKTLLSLTVGTDVQAYDAELAALAGLTSAADSFPYFTGSGTASLLTIVSAIRTLLASADVATFRSNAGLAIGTNVQAYDAELAALAGLTSAADSAPYFTGSGTAALMTVTSAARTVLDDTTTAAMLATLGALPAAGGTLTGEVDLGENAGLAFDAALSADGKYSGMVRSGTAGATLAFGDLCYLAAADSRWELVDANAESTSGGLLGMCVLAAAADGSATKMLMIGFIRADAAFPVLTIGAKVFASTTAGDVQTTAPSGTAEIIRVVGYADTADSFYFNPSPDYFEHA